MNNENNSMMTPNLENNNQNQGINPPLNNNGNQLNSSSIEQLDDNLLNEPIIETIPNDKVESLDVPIETLDDILESENQMPQVNNQPTNSKIPVDNFTAVPSPPIFEEKAPEKKKVNNKKTLIIILIFVLIIGIGFGLYYFLNISKNKATSSITPKEVKLELGNKLSDNVSDYANILGYNKNNCSIDTKHVNANKVGAYKFYVNCNENKVEGNITIDDTTSPIVTTTELVVLPNATIKPENFIETCVDASNCSYKFSNEIELSNNLSTIGEYEIDLLVSDDYNNETKVKAKLIVSDNAPVRYVTCTSKSVDLEDLPASLIESYKIGVDNKNSFYNALKSSEFKFKNDEDYSSIKNNYNEEIGIHEIIGKSTFNDNNKTIIIKGNRTLDEINKELEMNLAGDITTIQMFLTIKQFTCE